MLTVMDYLQVRTAHAQGESVRSLARRLHRAQKTIRKVIGSVTGAPAPYTRSGPTVYPKLGKFIGFIEQVLKDDQTEPTKQRHTAMQLYRRLIGSEFTEPYTGEYNAVRRYVQGCRLRETETFVPLTYQPGARLECDFGHIHVDYPDGRKLVSVLVAAWSFSQALFLIKLPNEKTESVLAGITAALEFFGCVPRELWWDNPKTVAWAIHRGRDRSLNEHFAALASHYRMEPLFCMPAKGQEKSDAERSVYAQQRRFGTPVPKVQNDDELNAYLRRFCEVEMTRTVAGRTRTIGEEFALEKAQALALPAHRFDACVTQQAVVDKYQTVRVERCRYSVPRECAFRPVTIKLYPETLQIVHAGKLVAEHRRLAETEATSLDPLHYLPTLLRKPATLDHANVFTTWQLPASFQELRQSFEHVHGPRAGTRHYIRVLQLLLRHPVERIERALAACRHRENPTAEIIAEKAQALAGQGAVPGPPLEVLAPRIPNVTVPPPDLRRFDQLLSTSLLTEPMAQGEHDHGHSCHPCSPGLADAAPRDAAQVPPQDPAAAYDAGGILQVGP